MLHEDCVVTALFLSFSRQCLPHLSQLIPRFISRVSTLDFEAIVPQEARFCGRTATSHMPENTFRPPFRFLALEHFKTAAGRSSLYFSIISFSTRI